MNLRHRKKATIYDIAEMVGTSSATVSRVLSNSSYPVKDEIRKKILEAAEKLNYSPSMAGRMLKSGRGANIGVVVPTISNLFYSQILLGIELEARKRGYYLFLCNSLRDPEAEVKYLEFLSQKQVQGIIISSIASDHKYLEELQKSGVRIVAFDQHIPDVKCSRVGFDHTKGALVAMEYLIRLGHTNIAFASAPITRRSRYDTREGYRLGLLKNSLPFREENVLISEMEEESGTGYYEFENGKRLVTEFLKLDPRPSAILAINDMTAIGLIQGLLEFGVRVPEDVSVVGFDNIEISSMINPPLTTVNQPSFETGRMAFRMLLDNMNDSDSMECTLMVEPSVVERRSVRDLRGEKKLPAGERQVTGT